MSIPSWASFPASTPELARLRAMVEAYVLEIAPTFDLAAAIYDIRSMIEVEEDTGRVAASMAILTLTEERGRIEVGLDPQWTPFLRSALEAQ